MNDQRFIEIETKSLYQEKLLEELHQALYEQQKMIDSLRAEVCRLKKQFEDNSSAPEVGPANEKPPHY